MKLLSIYKGVLEIDPPPRRTMVDIATEAAHLHGLQLADLKGASRLRNIVHSRQQAMAEMYATGRFSLPQIGAFLGGRDHTTVLHGVRAHKARISPEDRKCRSALTGVGEVNS